MASIPTPTCATRSKPSLPDIPTRASMTCCPGRLPLCAKGPNASKPTQSIATKLANFFASYRRRLLQGIRPQITMGMNHRLRLARSLKQLIETVENLEERGIGFRSLTEAIDTTTPGGRLVFQLFGALAEFERNVIRERTRAGLDAARARGKKGGRPAKLKEADLKAAKALLADPEFNVSDVARRLGV